MGADVCEGVSDQQTEPKSPRASGKPAVPHPAPACLAGRTGPGAPTAGRRSCRPSFLPSCCPTLQSWAFSCLLSVLALSSGPSLSLSSFCSLNSGFPLSPPTVLEKGQEPWGLASRPGTGFLLSHGFPKDRFTTLHTGGFSPFEIPSGGKMDNDYVFLCLKCQPSLKPCCLQHLIFYPLFLFCNGNQGPERTTELLRSSLYLRKKLLNTPDSAFFLWTDLVSRLHQSY